MEIRTSELSGIALDWAVAKAEDIMTRYHYQLGKPILVSLRHGNIYKPSSDWSIAGDIIRNNWITVKSIEPLGWKGVKDDVEMLGIEPLDAAMRCYVSFKLGDEIDIPDYLLEVDN